MLLISLNYFFGDFQKIKDKINYDHEIELQKFISEYEFNRCADKGYLPALTEKCDILLKKINLHKRVYLQF